MDKQEIEEIKSVLDHMKKVIEFGGKLEEMKKKSLPEQTCCTSKKEETMKTHSTPWIDFNLMVSQKLLKHYKEYLVRWLQSDGRYSDPRVATWNEHDAGFMWLEDQHYWPIRVNQVMEIPE